MHKQIASTALSLAFTLTMSIIPTPEIKLTDDKQTTAPVEQGAHLPDAMHSEDATELPIVFLIDVEEPTLEE